MNQNTTRSAYWDIIKGLAIIAVVMGHCGILTRFVYLFHLAVFFFVTGYFYNENKYGDDPFRYFGARLAGCWPRYFFYSICLVLVHNFFVTHGFSLYGSYHPAVSAESSGSAGPPPGVSARNVLNRLLSLLAVWPRVLSGFSSLAVSAVWLTRCTARSLRSPFSSPHG